MEGLIEEGEESLEQKKASSPAALDAAIIVAAQKVEHYEMASYGTVRTYAQVLGERGVARLLAQTLKEEKAADAKLTTIAERSVNEDAAQEWSSQEEGLLERSTAWMGATIDATSRQLASGARRAGEMVGLAQERPNRRTKTTRRSSGSTRARKSSRKTSNRRSS